MRFLSLIELYTSKDLSGNSMMNNMQAVLEGLDAIGSRHYCEWVVPPNKNELNWDDSYFQKPWINTLPMGDPFISQFDFPPISMETMTPLLPKKGKVLFDYVLNQKFFHSAALKLAFTVPPGKWYQQIEVPVVTYYTESSLDDRLPTMREEAGYALISSAAAVGPVFVMNEYDRDELFRVVRRCMSPSMVDRIMKWTYVIRACADYPPIDKQREEFEQKRAARRRETGKVAVFHGGSLEGKRHLEQVAKQLYELTSKGFPIQGVFKTQHTPKENPFGEQQVQLETGVGHRRYIESLHEGDVLVCACDYEGTGLAYMEAIRSGQIPVVTDTVWIRNRLPKDYPFIAKGMADLRVKLAYVAKNFDEVKAQWGKKLIEFTEPWGTIDVARAWDAAVKQFMEPVAKRNIETVQRISPAYGLLEEAVKAEQWPEVSDLSVVYKAMSARSRAQADFKYISPLAMKWMLTSFGYVDMCDGPKLHMKRG